MANRGGGAGRLCPGVVRYLEILVNLLRGRQHGLGLPTRPAEAVKLAEKRAGEPSNDHCLSCFVAAVRAHVHRRSGRDFPGLSGAMTILFFSPTRCVRWRSSCLRPPSLHPAGDPVLPALRCIHDHRWRGAAPDRLRQRLRRAYPGGLAIAAVLACMLFAALCGSSPATVAAVGSIVVAGMVRSGYRATLPPVSSATPGPWAF